MFNTKLLALALMLCLFMLSCGQDGTRSLFDSLFPEQDQEDPTLSMSRTDWQLASKPAQLGSNYVRGKLLWHTPRDLVAFDDVWDRESTAGEGGVRTFRMIFRPRHFETDTSIVADDQLVVDTTATGLKSWAGITSYLAGYYPHDTTQYFDLRVRGQRGRMHLEFGFISEDINGDGFAQTEDGIASGAQMNGVCEEEEDVGLDGLSDQEEQFYDVVTNPDPNGDNWYFLWDGKCPLLPSQCDNIDWDDPSIRYEWLNGTEGNINDPAVQGKPDAEALGYGFYAANSYFSFVIDLESDSFRVPDSNWPPGVGEDRQWWTYHIPIRDTAAMDEIIDEVWTPYWSQIRHIRIWFEDETTDNTVWDTVEIAQWGFLQTGTEPDLKPDSSMSIIRDYEYAKGRVFDLGYPWEFYSDDKVVNLIVYEEMRSGSDPTEADGFASFMVDPRQPYLFPTETITAFVKEVDPSTYIWCDDPDRNLHYIVFSSEVGQNLALGAFLQVQRGNDTITIGDLTYGMPGEALALLMLKHNVPLPSHYSWQLMWRNCYAMQQGMDIEDFNIKVFKGLPGSEMSQNVFDYQEVGGVTQSYLEILGLDQYNSYGQKYPDGLIDDRSEIYRPDWGLLIFPNREPFNSSHTFTDADGNETMPLQEQVPGIYNYIGLPPFADSKYFIRMVTYLPYH